jgi:hypothetical protein
LIPIFPPWLWHFSEDKELLVVALISGEIDGAKTPLVKDILHNISPSY